MVGADLVHYPAARAGQAWEKEIDSFDPAGAGGAGASGAAAGQAGDQVTVGPRSVVVLRGPRAPAG